MATRTGGDGSPRLDIRVLGELDLRLGPRRLPPLDSARAESLLAYLLVHRDAPQLRERIAFVLWPDSTEPQARTNLRHVLHKLRRALPDADRFLEVTQRTLQWRTDAPASLDLATFEDAIARSRWEDVAALREGVEAYGGDLLAGSYDEWLVDERERLRELYAHALERLAEALANRGEHAEAVRYGERLLRLDPLREESCRLVMRLHDARGDRARALRAYHACASALARDLGTEPSTATRVAYDALLPAVETPQVHDAQPPAHALIGRDEQHGRLSALWRACERGRALLVLVSGEAGIGKTRLVAELRRDCARAGAATASARCYRAEGTLAYGPVVAWLRSDALAARRGRLDAARLAELARLMPEVSESPPAELAGDEQRLRLFDALAEAVVVAAPVLLILDDAQWAERETSQFLHFLLRSRSAVPLMVAATARREELDDDHPLHDLITGLRAEEGVAEIELARLSREDTGVLASRVAGRLLDDRDADDLFAETEGNPLFLVEALRAGWRREDAERRTITPKVQAVIESRLAALSQGARALVGVAAAIGRDFTADLVASATGAEPDSLVRPLDELWRRRIIHEQGADAYDFSHDRIREVAYARVSPARRRDLHRRVARALERRHADEPGAASSQIAAHLDRAGARAEAIGWYLRAAQEAQRVHANLEAVRLLERGRALLPELPAGAERDERDLALDMALLAPLSTVDGVVSSRLVELQRRAVELSDALGREQPAPLLRSIALTSLGQGRLDEARRAGEQLRARGDESSDDVLLVESHYVLGIAAFWQADLEVAREHFEAAVERYRPEQRATHLARYGLDPEVVCISRLANALWFLGDAEAAVRTRDRALARAEEVGHPFSTAIARVFAGMLALDLGDEDGVRRAVAALQDASVGREGRAIRVSTEALAGYVDVLDGRTADGLARIRRAVDAAGAGDHAPGMRASAVRVLVEAHARAGDAAGGLEAVELMSDSPTGARLWQARILALRERFLAELDGRGTLAERPTRHAGAHDHHHTIDPRHD